MKTFVRVSIYNVKHKLCFVTIPNLCRASKNPTILERDSTSFLRSRFETTKYFDKLSLPISTF